MRQPDVKKEKPYRKAQESEDMKMDLYEKILAGEEKLSLVGLGYVGMPIAVAFARKIKVIGYDLNAEKIKLYQSGIDPTNEVGDDVIRQTEVEFTADETKLREAKFHIVAVPTPVNDDHTPDLTPVEGASRILGRNLTKGSVVVFESTVYPGVTEEVCVPILEKESGLVCGKDFKIGYSPERINPGDKVHRLETITKKLEDAGFHNFPIVLHGASSVDQRCVAMCNEFGGKIDGAKGIPAEMLRKASSMAVCKINMDTDLRLAMTAAIRKSFGESRCFRPSWLPG